MVPTTCASGRGKILLPLTDSWESNRSLLTSWPLQEFLRLCILISVGPRTHSPNYVFVTEQTWARWRARDGVSTVNTPTSLFLNTGISFLQDYLIMGLLVSASSRNGTSGLEMDNPNFWYFSELVGYCGSQLWPWSTGNISVSKPCDDTCVLGWKSSFWVVSKFRSGHG